MIVPKPLFFFWIYEYIYCTLGWNYFFHWSSIFSWLKKKKRLFRAFKIRGTVFSLFEKVYEVFGQKRPLYFLEGSHGRVICAGGDLYYLHVGIEYTPRNRIYIPITYFSYACIAKPNRLISPFHFHPSLPFFLPCQMNNWSFRINLQSKKLILRTDWSLELIFIN